MRRAPSTSRWEVERYWVSFWRLPVLHASFQVWIVQYEHSRGRPDRIATAICRRINGTLDHWLTPRPSSSRLPAIRTLRLLLWTRPYCAQLPSRRNFRAREGSTRPHGGGQNLFNHRRLRRPRQHLLRGGKVRRDHSTKDSGTRTIELRLRVQFRSCLFQSHHPD